MSSTGKFIRAIAAGTTGVVRQQVARWPGLVYAKDAQGNSALHVAIRRQRYDIASFLTKQGAKMSLQSAAALGDVAVVLDSLEGPKPGIETNRRRVDRNSSRLLLRPSGGSLRSFVLRRRR